MKKHSKEAQQLVADLLLLTKKQLHEDIELSTDWEERLQLLQELDAIKKIEAQLYIIQTSPQETDKDG